RWLRGGARPVAAGTCRRRPKTCTATATAASARPRRREGARGERGGGGGRGGGRARGQAPAAVVAVGGVDRAGSRPASLDARPAELLVRRGVHARARAAREPVGDLAHDRAQREHAAALVRDRVGRRARAGNRRGGPAPAFGARGRGDGAGHVGDRRRAGRPAGRAARRRADGGQPAVRVVLAGGARVRPVRADGGAADAVLPARRARADARAHGAVRADRRAGAADALLRGVPARADGAVAAVESQDPAIGAAGDRRARDRRACAAAADLRSGRAWDAMDRPLGPVQPPAGDSAVFPHRLFGRAARAWDRAARGAADPRRPSAGPLVHARPPTRATFALAILATSTLAFATFTRATTALALATFATAILALALALATLATVIAVGIALAADRAGLRLGRSTRPAAGRADRAADHSGGGARSDRARGLRRRLSRAAQPGRRDDPAERPDR